MFKSKLISLHKPNVVNLFNFLFKTKVANSPLHLLLKHLVPPRAAVLVTWGTATEHVATLVAENRENLVMTMVMATIAVIMMTNLYSRRRKLFRTSVWGVKCVHFTPVCLSKGPL